VQPSNRSAIRPFIAMDVIADAFKRIAAGERVISMAVGQPADPAPQAALAAARAALADGRISYTAALGIEPLREAIAAHYKAHYGATVPPSRIAITTGSSAGFSLAFLAAFEAGQTIAITAPGYPAYRNIIAALGLHCVEIPVYETGGVLTADVLRDFHARTPIDGLLIASPANPTGSIMPAGDFRALIDVCHAAGIRLISDEIYHRLNFSGPDVTALSVSNDVIVINSFSKYYCMTGWRIGWMVLPETMVRAVERLQQNLAISAPELSQIAAVAAFDATEELERVKARYALSRTLLASALPALGMPLLTPADGAFYAYCDVSAHTTDSLEFSRRMIAGAGVAAAPGLDFDPARGATAMRFSYAGSHADMQEAVERLGAWLKK
jgi:aspartate/methionine/tyrosine aminotransferase